jgi:hypothetical protein
MCPKALRKLFTIMEDPTAEHRRQPERERDSGFTGTRLLRCSIGAGTLCEASACAASSTPVLWTFSKTLASLRLKLRKLPEARIAA